MEAELTELVKHTQAKLRMQTISQVLEEFDGRIMGLDKEKRLQKYRKMKMSPYLFFRGSAYLFYFDIGREWMPHHSDPERPTWIQGDLHFENFGAFRSEKGRIVFDVNDFDEGCTGSYLYDVLRMSVSLFLIMTERDLPAEQQKDAVMAYLSAYAKGIRRFAQGKEDPSSLVFDVESTEGPIRKLLKKTEKLAASHLIEGITTLDGERREFVWSEEILKPTKEERQLVMSGWAEYLNSLSPETRKPDEYYRVKDVGVKHGSGTASIGLDRFYVLIEGDKGERSQDDIIIEIKEVRAPVPAYFMPYNEEFWEKFAHQGKRVIMTQQAMHHEADPFLGYLTLNGRQFYARERSPYKKKLKAHKIAEPSEWLATAESMGLITAKLHARADADVELGILSYHSEHEINTAIGKDSNAFCDYVTNRAFSYALQVKEDFGLFKEWNV
ncbi:DUF2252 domain-containing protein [Cohnella lupini]|uniref:Uncharacterized protein (DUF2252 family) n=1 Tax=Cohnella lupini TaxID=1294267 RepID=A0A3D9HR44_9BACL|nr:DUF2252 family protein [Cohnella lupini]RED51948.1 uncharacterized protein (DUF2252 family) [Cohnella lupini]